MVVARRAMTLIVVVVSGVACDGGRSGEAPAALPSSSSTVTSDVTGPIAVSPGGFCVEVALDVPTQCAVQTHCGVGMFASRVNGRWWVTGEGTGTLDYIPSAWGTYTDPPTAVTVVVTEDSGPVLIAELDGHAVTYRPLPDEQFRGCA
jgi:hypothetical protein